LLAKNSATSRLGSITWSCCFHRAALYLSLAGFVRPFFPADSENRGVNCSAGAMVDALRAQLAPKTLH
jgi:hypothetical protein